MNSAKINIDVVINEITQKIISVINPVKIYLFGSAAKKTFHQDSDLDFLIVVKDGINKRRTSQSIYKEIIDVGFACDIIVVTEQEFEYYKDDSYYIIKTARHEGKLIYG